MAEQKPFSVAIIGGGIVGVVLALALRHRKIDIQLYERAESLREVGASLGLNVSAAEALRICGPEAYEASQKVLTKPADSSVAIQFRDGYHQPSHGAWTVPWDGNLGGVHRGHFLDALVANLPKDVIHFQKNLTNIEEPSEDWKEAGDKVKMTFDDGSTAFADVVVGADGLGSRVRRLMLGEEHPSARAKYAHQYVYRSVIPMEKAIEILGKDDASRVTQWFGKGGSVVTVPIGKGTLFGISAIARDSSPWPSDRTTVLPASKDDVVSYYQHWGPEIRALVDTIEPGRVDRWALFDLAENPVPTFARGRVAIMGDAAHASTPHQGSGAMCGLEDAAVLAELLADERMQGSMEQLEQALAVYGEIRIKRGQWVAEASRKTGDRMHLVSPTMKILDGQEVLDVESLEREVMGNFDRSWNREVLEHVRLAKEEFGKRLARVGAA